MILSRYRFPLFPTVLEVTVRNGQERWETVGNGEGLKCHDDGRSVTMGRDDLKMVTAR
jgi:hypothetical protein